MKRVVIITALMLAALFAACTAKPDPNAWKVVTVSSSGDSSHLSIDQIIGNSHVKIVGTINERDFFRLRSCPTLYHLDLSEATVVGDIVVSYKDSTHAQIIQTGNAIPSGAFGQFTAIISARDTTVSLPAHKSLRSIIFPKQITTIGRNAFAYCGLNRPLELPNTVSTIYDSAFSNCGSMTGQLILPERLTYLGAAAFSQCANLTGTLTIPSQLDSVAQFTFSNCSGISALVLPEGLKRIGRNAFATLSISSIKLPQTIESIEANAFRNCRSLVGSLTLPQNLRLIGDRAFNHCGFDSVLVLNAALSLIGVSAFDSTNFASIEANWTQAIAMPRWDASMRWFPERFEVKNNTKQYLIHIPASTLNIYQYHFANKGDVFYNFEQRP